MPQMGHAGGDPQIRSDEDNAPCCSAHIRAVANVASVLSDFP
jgi:hypothetical protein